jgi:hypothetical protein
LKEEHRLRVFENRLLRRMFGLKWDEVTGEWRRLLNEGLYALYSTPNIIQVIKSRLRWAGHGGQESYIHSVDGETSGKETTWKS